MTVAEVQCLNEYMNEHTTVCMVHTVDLRLASGSSRVSLESFIQCVTHAESLVLYLFTQLFRHHEV